MHGQLSHFKNSYSTQLISTMFPQQNDAYSSFYPAFSPPTLSHGSLHDIIFASSAQPPPPLEAQEAPPALACGDRPTRKDRHRKINTAKGPRDRRMRLSLDVARKFFDLQDLLAFDKASKTVQWLLNKSKAAIKDHVAASKGKSSFSECEERKSPTVSENKQKMSTRVVEVRKRRSNVSIKPKVARECRDKARARARERTLEKKNKMMMMPLAFNSVEEELSLEMLEEMGAYCSINSPTHQMETDGNGSMAISYYNDAVENLYGDPWGINLAENMDDRVLLAEIPLEMSFESPIIQPVFDHM